MNVTFLSHRVPYPPNKGEKIRTFHQLEYLAQQGHQLQVFAPLEHAQDQENAQQLEQKLGLKLSHSSLPAKPLRLLSGLLKGEALSVANFYSAALQQAFDDYLRTNSVDCIVCTSSSMAKYIFNSKALSSMDKRPCLLMDFMDLDSDKWRQYQKLKTFPVSWIYQREAKLVAALEAKVQKHFDAGLFISANEVTLFKSIVGPHDNTHVIANGLDTQTFTPAAKPKSQLQPSFIFTGVMDYFPNEDAVIWFCEAMWPRVRANYPEAEFYIAGMNPSAKVKKLAELPGVIVTGFVDDIVEYYHKADIFVAPFRLARGVQNKVLQAFACGLPVVTTQCGAEGISCQQGKDILIADTEDAICSAIEELLQDSEKRQNIAQAGLKLVREQYSWAGQLSQLEELMQAKENN